MRRATLSGVTPALRLGRWRVWVVDERWRLRFRWYDAHGFRDGAGYAVMLCGWCVVVGRV